MFKSYQHRYSLKSDKAVSLLELLAVLSLVAIVSGVASVSCNGRSFSHVLRGCYVDGTIAVAVAKYSASPRVLPRSGFQMASSLFA